MPDGLAYPQEPAAYVQVAAPKAEDFPNAEAGLEGYPNDGGQGLRGLQQNAPTSPPSRGPNSEL